MHTLKRTCTHARARTHAPHGAARTHAPHAGSLARSLAFPLSRTYTRACLALARARARTLTLALALGLSENRAVDETRARKETDSGEVQTRTVKEMARTSPIQVHLHRRRAAQRAPASSTNCSPPPRWPARYRRHCAAAAKKKMSYRATHRQDVRAARYPSNGRPSSLHTARPGRAANTILSSHWEWRCSRQVPRGPEGIANAH
mmetsp:Transcript_14096/g.23398  ORF Transcript_14096/g.23398 Transcript_14096/m.23398 type:complete len:204 (-) Transcript_14096:487-1098(-)